MCVCVHERTLEDARACLYALRIVSTDKTLRFMNTFIMKIIISPTTAVVLRAGGKAHGAPDGGIRVPTILKWPGKVASGQVTDEPVSLMDVLPTIARAVHAQLPANHVVDGKDLLPLLTGDEGRSPHEFLFHYCQDRVDAVRYRPREGEWTLGRENKHVSP